MTADQARDEMLAVFKTAWDSSGLPVVYGDKPGSTNEGGWARVTVRHSDGGQATLSGAMGSRRFTRTGTLWVQVFAPAGDGNVMAYDLAETVLTVYQRAGDAVWYRNPRMREVGSDGAFSRIDVLVDFTYDSIT